MHTSINKSENIDIRSIIAPAIAITRYGLIPDRTVYTVGVEGKRESYLINKLKKLIPEVPVLMSQTFNNACHIPNLDKAIDAIREKYGDEAANQVISDLAKQLGIDSKILLNNLGPNIIVLGRDFTSAAVLAHEIGHYLNTIGRESPAGYDAHKKYGRSKRMFKVLDKLSGISYLSAIILCKFALPISLIIALASAGLNLTSVIMAHPIIKAETSASKTALKLLIRIQVTPEELVYYRDQLVDALKSYKKPYRWRPLLKSAAKGTTVAGGLILG